MKEFRNNGAIGALLDEYEKATKELQTIIMSLSDDELTRIVDGDAKDEDCRSIQSILSHVVGAGKNYVLEVRKSLGEEVTFTAKPLLNSVQANIEALEAMFMCNHDLFQDYPSMKLEESEPDKKFIVRWGQSYDVEQIFEHAIVHILRHRRQIERFLLLLRAK